MTIKYAKSKRKQTKRFIDENPVTVTVINRPAKPSQNTPGSETRFTATARVCASSQRVQFLARPSAGLSGEISVGRFPWVVLFEYDVDAMDSGDTLTYVINGYTRTLRIEQANRFDYKVEAMCDDYR